LTGSRDHDSAVRREYRTLAREYDRRWAHYLGVTVERTVACLPLTGDADLLDVGCGTGVLLDRLALAYPRARLTGVEPVPEMRELARARLPARVSVCAARAQRLPFTGSVFDAVVCTSVLHHLPAEAAAGALREISRVLRPGGRVVITDWSGDAIACRLYAAWLRLRRPAPLHLYRADRLRALLQRAGFAGVRLERYRASWPWSLMTAAAHRA